MAKKKKNQAVEVLIEIDGHDLTAVPNKRSTEIEQRVVKEDGVDYDVYKAIEELEREMLEAAEAAFDPAFTSSGTATNRLAPLGGSELSGADQNESSNQGATAGIEAELPTGGTLGVNGDVLDRARTNSVPSLKAPGTVSPS